MPLDYEAKIKEASLKNKDDVVRALEAGELNTTIRNFCNLHGIERDKVIHEIKNNEVVAALFSKKPGRQRIHENLAAEYIENMEGVSNFVQLPSNKFDVFNGRVIERKILKAQGKRSRAKSIDFNWKYGGADFWAAHKYTKERGGAQDHQYAELREFVIQSRGNALPNTFFIAIADGQYYQYKEVGTEILKIQNLKQMADQPHIQACTICELEQLMKRL